ncbi:MAG: hypothetical protein HDR33_00365 [Treponema sp.]|nr:hypothetical protein [Treponema sp.]
MNNASRYNKTRLALFLKGIFPSLLSLFLPRNKKLVILNSFHNCAFSNNTKFLFLYMIENCPEYEIEYVVNDDMLQKQLCTKYGNHFIQTKSFKGIVHALKAKCWIVNALEFPVGGFFLNFRRNVILLTHGVTSKQAGLAEKRVSLLKRIYYRIIRTDLSYALTPCFEFRHIVAAHFGLPEKKILVAGFPRFDPLLQKVYTKIEKSHGEISILYAPTWRHYTDVKFFPFPDFNETELEEFCERRKLVFYLRVHPRFENSIPEKIRNLPFVKIFSGLQYPEINDYLLNFDILITDYSSIFYDFMILDRPLFFLMYDRDEYEKQIGLAVDFNRFATGYKPSTQEEFIQCMEDAFERDSFKAARRSVRKTACGESKNNSRELVNLLKRKKLLYIIGAKK